MKLLCFCVLLLGLCLGVFSQLSATNNDFDLLSGSGEETSTRKGRITTPITSVKTVGNGTVDDNVTVTDKSDCCGELTEWNATTGSCQPTNATCGVTTVWNGTTCIADLEYLCTTLSICSTEESSSESWNGLERPPDWAIFAMGGLLFVLIVLLIGLACRSCDCCSCCCSEPDHDFDSKKLKRVPDSYSNPAWRQSFSATGSIDAHEERPGSISSV